MIVDDVRTNVRAIEAHLMQAGYRDFVTETDPRRVIPLMTCEQPDILLLDVQMPEVSGLEVLKAIRAHTRLKNVPVVLVTAQTDPATKREALDEGATGFLSKPVDPSELTLCVQNVLGAAARQEHLRHYSERLERHVRQRTAEVEESRREVVRCLAQAAELRDDDTGRHIVRVGHYVGIIARQLGFSRETASRLNEAAQLHDVGKIGIPDSILLKPGAFTPQEFELMKTHCAIGFQILEPGISGTFATESGTWKRSGSPLLSIAATIALTHHERWDGSGYPSGLSGENIPIEGRITAVADVFDALSHPRPYKPAFELEECIRILEEKRGSHFDPDVLDAFLACREEVFRFHHSNPDDAELSCPLEFES